MSNALAIAAVTETLVRFLSNAIVGPSQVPDAWVSAVPPTPDQPLANPGVNVFLYQVTPNAAYRNADVPTRALDSVGTLIRKPVVALDLHYLLTFYGDETALVPQRLLGATTIALHRNPNMQRSIVQPAPIQPLDQQHHLAGVADSGLANQSQLIRFTPVTYTLEELSKLWSFLLKVDYVLSTAYIASVLLIESDDVAPPDAPQPLAYSILALPLRQPTIASVVNASNPALPITAGGQIALSGSNLASATGGATQVLINGQAQSPAIITPNRIVLTLPGNLSAGPTTAQVTQSLSLGTPPVSHPGAGATSGIFSFVLAPAVAPGATPGSFAITVLTAFGSPPGPALSVGVIPTAQSGQRALLLLTGGSPPGTRLIDGGKLTANTDTLIFPLPSLPGGAYFVQVMVDGARSALTPPQSPTGPVVNL
jgi:hypothetical protein